MWKSVAYRSYSTHQHTNTHKVFHKLFKNKINIDPSVLSPYELRTQMALYMINNPNKYHKNHPELLDELQLHQKFQYKKLLDFKTKIENDIKLQGSSDSILLNSLFLHEIDYRLDELLQTHRKKIRKVDSIKHHSPDFWSFKLPEE